MKTAKFFPQRYLLLTLLIVMATGFAVELKDDEQEKKLLERIVTEMEAGISQGDNKPWIKWMADNGVLVNRDGNSNTKQEIVDEIKPLPPGKILAIKPVNFKIYLSNKTAMVSFLADEKLSIHGQVVDTKYPSVMYFEKRRGQWQMIFFSYFEKPVDPSPVKMDKASMQAYAGTYRVSDAMKIEVTVADSGLLMKKPGSTGKSTQLYPIDHQGRFFRAGTESEYIFTTNQAGLPIIRQRRNWIDLVWTKENN